MGIDARVYAVTTAKLTDAEVLRLAYDVGRAFGSDKFFRSEGWGEKKENAHHNISRVEKIEQDGPDWTPEKGATLIEVHVWTRYYGVNYERGDLPFLISLAEWLERRLPNGRVLYGGDSSGVCAEPFDAKARGLLLDHFASKHGRDYYNHDNPFIDDKPGLPTCDYCKVPMPQYGYGPGQRNGKFSCGGCGKRMQTKDGGATFTEYKELEYKSGTVHKLITAAQDYVRSPSDAALHAIREVVEKERDSLLLGLEF